MSCLAGSCILRLFKVAGRKYVDATELKPWKKYACIRNFIRKEKAVLYYYNEFDLSKKSYWEAFVIW